MVEARQMKSLIQLMMKKQLLSIEWKKDDVQDMFDMKVSNSGYSAYLSFCILFQKMAKQRAKLLLQAKRKQGREKNEKQMFRNIRNQLKLKQLLLRIKLMQI